MALALCLALLAGVSLAPYPALAAILADVNGHWAETEITILHASGIISGYPDGSFRPDAAVTRAEVVKMLVEALRFGGEVRRVSGSPLPALFSDVSGSDWFLPYLVVAFERGLIRGYDDGTFRGNAPVTRAELAVLLERAVPMLPEGGVPGFTDGEQIPPWAFEQVASLVKAGLIRGHDDGSFRPQAGATRAEVSVMMCRLMALRGDLVQVRGIVVGWVVRDREGELVPETLLATLDGLYEVSVKLAPDFRILSGAGLAGWQSLRVGQDVGLIINNDGYLRLMLCRFEGETEDLLDPAHFLRPRREGGGL